MMEQVFLVLALAAASAACLMVAAFGAYLAADAENFRRARVVSAVVGLGALMGLGGIVWSMIATVRASGLAVLL